MSDAPGPTPLGESDLVTRLRRDHGGARVLVVEDNPVNQLLACALLHGVGLQTQSAENGLEAVEQAQIQPFALVLMDVQMPVLDGLQATRAIRAEARLADLPILAMTANSLPEDRAACMAAGMNDHIVKPVVPQRLYEALLHWLDRPRDAAAASAQVGR